MAFYIESRFVDIRTLVDFSEFDEANFNHPPVTLDSPTPGTNNAAPPPAIQSQEVLDNSQALLEVTKIIIDNEKQIVNSPTIAVSDLTAKVVPITPNNELIIVQLNETAPVSTVVKDEPPLVTTTVEVVDKTSLYAQYISQKYEKETAAEFIKILLNPFIVILAYRYDFNDNQSDVQIDNQRNVVSFGDKNILTSDDESESEPIVENNLHDALRKKDLDRKMQRRYLK